MGTAAVPDRSSRPVSFYAAVLVGAAGIGLLSAVNPLLAVSATVGVVAVPGAILRPKLVPFLLLLTIFAEFVTIGGITVSRLAAPIAAIAVLSQAIDTPGRLAEAGARLRPVGLYSVLAVASLFWTVSVDGTLYQLGSLAIALAYMGVFALAVRHRDDLRRLLWFLAAGATVLSLWWLRSYIVGVGRFESEAGDPNFVAALLVVALPLHMALASATESTAGRILLYGLAGLGTAATLATLSRGGTLTLAAALLVMAILPARGLFGTRARKLAFFTLAAAALVVVLGVTGSALVERFRTEADHPNLAGSRGDLWLAALNGYEEHPILGLGYGGFKAVSYQLLRTTPGVNLPYHVEFRFRDGEFVHNVYLGSLVEMGPLGLVAFLALLWGTARNLLEAARRADQGGDAFLRSVSHALLVSLAAFAVASMFLSSETSRMLWMIVGLSAALPGMAASEP